MKPGFRITNVTDKNKKRGTSQVVPRVFHGLGITLNPGESIIVDDIPGEIEAIVADTKNGTLAALPIDLNTGDPL